MSKYIDIQPVVAVITSAPTDPARRGTIPYLATVQTQDGQTPDVQIGPSSADGWDDPFLVRPLREGKAIGGWSINGVIQWDYSEMPKTGLCNGQNLVAPGVAASQFLSMFFSLTIDQQRAIKRALEAV